MNQTTVSKWKPWHKLVMGLLMGIITFVIIIVVSTPEKKEYVTPAQQHKKNIEKYFSAWDGTHTGLVNYLKENMNDPASLEPVETSYTDYNSYIIVNMKYRANNAFGAKMLSFIKARCDTAGHVLEIIESR